MIPIALKTTKRKKKEKRKNKKQMVYYFNDLKTKRLHVVNSVLSYQTVLCWLRYHDLTLLVVFVLHKTQSHVDG